MSDVPAEVISTHALGSCIAVTAYDAYKQIGGLIHFQLPYTRVKTDHPFRYGDPGLPKFLNEMIAMGAQLREMEIHLFGGAVTEGGTDHFDIGRKNLAAAEAILKKNQLDYTAEHIGDVIPRTVHLELFTGELTLVTSKNERLVRERIR